MFRSISIFSAVSLLTIGSLVGQSVQAASTPIAGYVGENPSSVPNCPYLVWRLAKHADGTITGIVFYSDLSGLSLAKGNIDQKGQFHFELTSALGEGPVATVDGMTKGRGKTAAKMNGAGCANSEVKLTPVNNLNKIPMASQNSYKG